MIKTTITMTIKLTFEDELFGDENLSEIEKKANTEFVKNPLKFIETMGSLAATGETSGSVKLTRLKQKEKL